MACFSENSIKYDGDFISLWAFKCVQVRGEKSNKLEMYFRPEDPYSHPVSGELQPCTKFLLKFSKKKVKDIKNVTDHSGHASADPLHLNEDILISQATETTENNGPQEQLSANIVARVSEEYHFNGDLFSYSLSYFTFDMDPMHFLLCYL